MSRHGFHLVEVLLALALAGGPLLITLQLMRSTTRQAAVAKELATTRLVLMDYLTVLSGESIEDLRELATPGSTHLQQILNARVARMPVTFQTTYREQVARLAGRLECHLEEDVGGVTGLSRLTLSGLLGDGDRVLVFRLFRPSSRDSLESGDPRE